MTRPIVPLATLVEMRTAELATAEPSRRLARFKAEREIVGLAIDHARDVEGLREVLRFMHRKIYS